MIVGVVFVVRNVAVYGIRLSRRKDEGEFFNKLLLDLRIWQQFIYFGYFTMSKSGN